MRVSVVCVIDDGEEMLCDDNSKLKRNARFSCLFQLFVIIWTEKKCAMVMVKNVVWW